MGGWRRKGERGRESLREREREFNTDGEGGRTRERKRAGEREREFNTYVRIMFSFILLLYPA